MENLVSAATTNSKESFNHTEVMDSILFNQEPPACQIDRYARLYVKLRQIFKKNIATLLVPNAVDLTAQRFDDTTTGIHIYIDLSNIYIGFNQCIEHQLKSILSTYDNLFKNGAEYDDRYCLYNKIKQKLANRPNSGYIHGLDFAALNIILQKGRAVATKSLSGSIPEKYKSDPDPNLFQAPSYQASGRSKLSKQNAMASIYDHMFDEARKNGYSATIMKRVSSSHTENNNSTSEKFKEHGVDEILCIQILQTVLQKSLQSPKPKPTLLTDSPLSKSKNVPSTPSAHIPTGTIVLATGDGQPFSFSVLSKHSPSLTSLLSKDSDNDGDAPWPSSSLGFYSVIEKALSLGWNVELYSFGHSLSYNWSQLAKLPSLSQNRFRIVYLDEFVFELATNEMAADLYKLLNM